jgi:hypothetical protein
MSTCQAGGEVQAKSGGGEIFSGMTSKHDITSQPTNAVFFAEPQLLNASCTRSHAS